MTNSTLKPGWTWVKFGDVVRQAKDKVDAKSSGLKRYIAGEHMNTDDLRIRHWGEINDDYLGPAFHMRFKPGQVLYGSRRTYLRKVAAPDFEGICANTTFVLETKDPTVLLPELLPFIMQTEVFHEYSITNSKGSVNPYINFSDLAEYEFALPPMAEQRRIAEGLNDIEKSLESLADLESKTESLRKSYIIDTFSRILHESKTRIVKVTDAGQVLMGRQRSPKYAQGISPRPYLRVANVFDGYIDTTDVKIMDFSDDEFEKYGLKSGDVLLVEGHSSSKVVGRSSIYQNEVPDCCLQNTLIRFRPTNVLSEYAQHYFQFCLYTERFVGVANQTTIAHLGAKRFAAMKFPLVGAKVEQQVVQNLAYIEGSLQRVVQRKANIEQLKRLFLDTKLSPN